jgi:hypothetical protein
MAPRQVERDESAHTVADYHGLDDPFAVAQERDVVRHGLDRRRSLAGRAPRVPAQVRRQHPVGPDEVLEVGVERVVRAQATMY